MDKIIIQHNNIILYSRYTIQYIVFNILSKNEIQVNGRCIEKWEPITRMAVRKKGPDKITINEKIKGP